jgi:predicted nucleotidyltransferase
MRTYAAVAENVDLRAEQILKLLPAGHEVERLLGVPVDLATPDMLKQRKRDEIAEALRL